jgi:hypothetical protein
VAWNDSKIEWAHRNWIGRQRSAPDPDMGLARDLAARFEIRELRPGFAQQILGILALATR